MNFFLVLVLIFSAVKCDERGGRVRRIVGGEPAAAPPEDDPVVFTKFSGRSARILGVRDYPHYVFRGIRYAYAPVGAERFLRPRQYLLEGFENATKFPPPCLQPVPGQNKVVGSEDCLFLNVFTPTLPTGMEGLPVIVWIHGGGFRYGSASQYGVRHLVGKQVVVVTIQYRLGSLGLLSTGTKTLPGNAAVWDMFLAVQWTRNYIGFFGGNPHKITVMGHGSGASSAIMVALSNVAKGLAKGVVAMSGTSVSRSATDSDPKNTAMEVARENGCPTRSEITMVKCLQNLPGDSLVSVDSFIETARISSGGFIAALSGRLGTGPVYEGRRDGRSLPPLVEQEPVNDPDAAHSKIPLLTGVTKDETKRACQGQLKADITSQLKSVKGFLDNVLIKDLQNTLDLDGVKTVNEELGSLLGLLNPDQFKNYLNIDKTNIHKTLGQISQATSDVLFNVPAFLTADSWSKQDAPSFLYSFEYAGKRMKGYSFLKGVPLIGNSTQSDESDDIVSHGDELSYLFDVHDLEGKSLESDKDTTEEDSKVRDVFTKMITDFARHGKASLGDDEVEPFSTKDNSYMQISATPKIAKNFRYCEVGLWVGIAERLKSSSCQVFKVLNKLPGGLLGGAQDQLGGTLSQVGNPLGGGKNVADTLTKVPSKPIRKQEKVMDPLGLGGFIG